MIGVNKDQALLIHHLHTRLDEWGEDLRQFWLNGSDLVKIEDNSDGSPSIVVGDDLGAELGRPPATSHAILLLTTQPQLLADGRVSCIGPDLESATPSSSLPFAQVVMLALPHEHDTTRFALEATQYLANRLPGYMARTIPGRLWIRFSKEALNNGMRLHHLGFALITAFRLDFPEITASEVLLASDRAAVESISTLAELAKTEAQTRPDSSHEAGGIGPCQDLDCLTCDQRPLCDSISDLATRYRQGNPA